MIAPVSLIIDEGPARAFPRDKRTARRPENRQRGAIPGAVGRIRSDPFAPRVITASFKEYRDTSIRSIAAGSPALEIPQASAT